MDYNVPHTDWRTYSPGLFSQDLVTMPLEAGLVYAITRAYWPQQRPLPPFASETTDRERQKTRHPAEILRFSAIGLAGLGLGAVSMSSDEYSLGVQCRGWIHAHLLTEMATATAKVAFQRKRPFYDRVKKASLANAGPPPREDDRFSFFSGHASHAFAFAGYSTALVLRYLDFSWFTVGYTVTSLGFATYIAASRALDGQHNWSDVVTGAAVGYVVSQLVFNQTQKIARIGGQPSPDEVTGRGHLEWSVSPFMEWTGDTRPGISFQGIYRLPSKGI